MNGRGFRLRRCAAAVVDGAAALLIALLTGSTLGHYFAARAVVTLRIGEPDSVWRGPLPLVLGAVGEIAYGLPLALVLVLLAEPLTGRTPGKALLGLDLHVRGDGRAGGGRLWLRFAVKASAPLLWMLALLTGRWEIAAAGAVAAAAVLAGGAGGLVGGGSLHDLAAGSGVSLRSDAAVPWHRR